MADDMIAGATRWRRRRWWGVGMLVLGGCSSTCDGSSEPGTIGELGNGRFEYVCTGSGDPVCERQSNDQFPDCIALGGRFDLDYQLLDTSILGPDELSGVLYIESVNQGFFRGNDDFEALRTGRAAFVVREDDSVIDLLHLDIVEADGIEVSAIDPTMASESIPVDNVQVELGATEEFRVFPRSSRCTQLGGAIPIDADSSDEMVATVGGGDVLSIQGQALGVAVVRARLGELEQAITVEVVEATEPPATGTDGDTGDTDPTGTTAGDGTTAATTGSSGSSGSSDSGSASSSTGMAT
ncbi:MAG: hypothetical protein AB1Z98_37770 [Nannocystaceae bacterium]